MTETFAIKTISEEDFQGLMSQLSDILPRTSHDLLSRFRKKNDLQRSLLGEALVRVVLSKKQGIPPDDLNIQRTEKGKPIIIGKNALHFNISHSGDWVIAAISDQEVGIDIEKIRTPQYRIAERYFSAHEVEMLNSREGDKKIAYFFQLWTLKESYLKLLGKGLTKSLGSFSMVQFGQRFRLVIKNEVDEFLHFYPLNVATGYQCSLCTTSNTVPGNINFISVSELIKRLQNA